MSTNPTYQGKLVYPELSYNITGICFQVHNELGRFAREKQYADLLEIKLREKQVQYKSELNISNSGNIIDFFN